MRGVSAGLAACLVAAVTAGCGTAAGSQPGSAARTATAGQTSGAGASGANPARSGTAASTAGPAETGMPSGCQGQAARSLVITLAGNGRTYCVRVGGKVTVSLRGTAGNLWLRPLTSSGALTPSAQGTLAPARGVTGASFDAVRPGQALLTSVRPPCEVKFPLQKGDLEPAFPVPRTYPLRLCAPDHRFRASIVVLG